MPVEHNISSGQPAGSQERGQTAPSPTVPAQRRPEKPIKTIRIAAYVMVALAALGLISNFARLRSRFTARLPKSAHSTKPSTVAPDAITSFEQQQQEQIKKLEQENAEAQQASQRAAEAAKGVSNLAGASMMPCTPALIGTQGTSSAGAPIVCGADGQWHPSTEANGIPAMTAAQRRALYGQNAGGSTRDDAAQKAKQHRLEALNSSSVAIDFTSTGTPAHGTKEIESSESQPSAPSDIISRDVEPGTKHAVDLKNAADQGDSRKPNYQWDHYDGKLYRVFEGTVLETVLTNRINGAFAGPINTMLTTDIWSHDHQQLLIPQGTRCLGTVSAVNSAGQQRLFVAFHRCIMPDGYSLDLDKFVGLNQIGEAGLRDIVNHHYFQIFGASLAIGAVGGLAQIGNGYSTFGYDPSVAIRNGISQQMGQESMQILDRFLNQLPTFIVRE
ncbi:MAG: TrbI/VirB10 family protein, partial [Acidobacteriaceae bacterium]|nr:TrbI/VirB10 family protein [Acidobacteriaceae bacterium]